MTLLKIARMGHPVLTNRAEDVIDFTASDVLHLVEDMMETMDDGHGVGLDLRPLPWLRTDLA